MALLIQLVTLALLAVLTLQAVMAQGLPSGKYLIISREGSSPPLPIGFDENGPVNPVTVGGQNKQWTVQQLANEEYTITAEEAGVRWLAGAIDGEVLVGPVPQQGGWIVQRQEGNSYTIEVPGRIWPSRAWTLDSPNPGSKVRLGIMEFPRPGQLWNFVRVFD